MLGLGRLSNVLDKTFGIIEIGVNRIHDEVSFHDEMFELENSAKRIEKRKEIEERIAKSKSKVKSKEEEA